MRIILACAILISLRVPGAAQNASQANAQSPHYSVQTATLKRTRDRMPLANSARHYAHPKLRGLGIGLAHFVHELSDSAVSEYQDCLHGMAQAAQADAYNAAVYNADRAEQHAMQDSAQHSYEVRTAPISMPQTVTVQQLY